MLLNRKKFQAEDFRENHPGGSLGERLKVKVREVMLVGDSMPVVLEEEQSKETIKVLNDKNIGAVLVVDGDSKVKGIVTDGDVRRCLADICNFSGLKAREIMTEDPVCITEENLAADALSIMQKHEITILPIVGEENTLLGVLHLHNLLGKGEFRFLV